MLSNVTLRVTTTLYNMFVCFLFGGGVKRDERLLILKINVWSLLLRERLGLLFYKVGSQVYMFTNTYTSMKYFVLNVLNA